MNCEYPDFLEIVCLNIWYHWGCYYLLLSLQSPSRPMIIAALHQVRQRA